MDTLHEFIFPKEDKDPEYYEREEEEVIPEKDNSSFVTRTNEAIEALLQLSSKQSESNVADVSGGDVDDGGAEDGDVVGELDEFCHVDLVDLLNQFGGQGLHDVLAYNVMAHIENSMKLLTMKNRERGSITSTLKVNTLRGRWFNNLNAVNGDLPFRSVIEQGRGGIVLERDVVVELPVHFNGQATLHQYKVVGVYTKYNNKYFLVKDGSITVKDKCDQVFVYVAMIKLDPVNQNFVNVLPISSAFVKTDIWKRVKAADCIGHVIGKLS